jgi:hypothetical protein
MQFALWRIYGDAQPDFESFISACLTPQKRRGIRRVYCAAL